MKKYLRRLYLWVEIQIRSILESFTKSHHRQPIGDDELQYNWDDDEFVLTNARDAVKLCHEQIQSTVLQWAHRHEFTDERAQQVWLSCFELLLNALIHGSATGDSISIKLAKSNNVKSLAIDIEQPFAWLGWDELFSPERLIQMQKGENLFRYCGTAVALRLANEIEVLTQDGKLIRLHFQGDVVPSLELDDSALHQAEAEAMRHNYV